MGIWSTALFGNDIAIDVRENYMGGLRAGMSNAKASREAILGYEDELGDACEASIVWCALAATQWKVGRLQKSVLSKALRAIKNGGDLPRWEAENSPREVASRRRVLDSLRKKLESDPPPEKKIRIKQPVEIVKGSFARGSVAKPPWKKGEVIAFDRLKGNLVLLFVEGVRKDSELGYETYLSLLDWKGKKVPAAAKLQTLKLLLDSACILWDKRDPIPLDRIQRLNIQRRGRGNIRVDQHGVDGLQTDCTWKELAGWIKETSTKKQQEYLKSLS